MRKYAVFTLAALLSYFHYADACSCLFTHPQQQYCNADFVILARIKQVRTFNETKVYKVRIKKEYKMSEKALVALKSGLLRSAVEESLCGIDLNIGKVYALSGRIYSLKAHINFCDMALLWRDLTRRQRKGLKKLYRNGCTCRISYRRFNNFAWNSTQSIDSCYMRNGCHITEGVCLRTKSKRCAWTRNKLLYDCLNNK